MRPMIEIKAGDQIKIVANIPNYAGYTLHIWGISMNKSILYGRVEVLGEKLSDASFSYLVSDLLFVNNEPLVLVDKLENF